MIRGVSLDECSEDVSEPDVDIRTSVIAAAVMLLEKLLLPCLFTDVPFADGLLCLLDLRKLLVVSWISVCCTVIWSEEAINERRATTYISGSLVAVF